MAGEGMPYIMVMAPATPHGGDGDMAYAVDATDHLIAVDASWDRFAVANGGATIIGPRILGRPLWDFITDAVTIDLYRSIMARARAGRSFAFPFRCDSPECRRHLEMQVSARGNDELHFRTRVVRLEAREALPDASLDASPEAAPVAAADLPAMLRSCSWCKRVFVAGTWIDVEEAAARHGVLDQHPSLVVTHGICESCHASMLAVIDAR